MTFTQRTWGPAEPQLLCLTGAGPLPQLHGACRVCVCVCVCVCVVPLTSSHRSRPPPPPLQMVYWKEGHFCPKEAILKR